MCLSEEWDNDEEDWKVPPFDKRSSDAPAETTTSTKPHKRMVTPTNSAAAVSAPSSTEDFHLG